MSPEAFAADTGVSRETLVRLSIYAELLAKWQPRINLVAPSTMPELWHRHMLDSAQLVPLLPSGATTMLDIGSGAGFPGLVIAIMRADLHAHLVESDTRKATFLREAARLTKTTSTIHARRIEELKPFPVDIVTARACAPLIELLDLAEPFLTPGSTCIFPKGARAEDELTEAGKRWNMRIERHPSRTAANSTVLRLSDIKRIA
ncbi:MAG: 16S rRNA (guanine(527)-N(7))-methyltransferase RsmG [Alphaproteobacteria bacterium]